ncbi:hypothetical protein ES319_D01G084900v1 [Gossypium barbadense]|uniref:Uncharacterized protein n=1 Tax=Gossypium barbadense TaxID=3634 RepID=A0A5J5SS81_GOSBA|nr:hypothetical protein ES319_D01G084400v1 [Gossypium barbadense]KAB2044366.1 hypothetical protein ES319_D01G084900v1 [Gossypium barbadense]
MLHGQLQTTINQTRYSLNNPFFRLLSIKLDIHSITLFFKQFQFSTILKPKCHTIFLPKKCKITTKRTLKNKSKAYIRTNNREK